MPSDIDLTFDGPKDASKTMILAHGAGAGMDTPLMNFFAHGLAERGIRVVRFEFPYMEAKRRTGKGKPPDREPVLIESWMNVIETVGRKGLVIGGKSMGGRIASMVADEASVSGLVCLGYPFHPVGKPDRLRVEHLQSLETKTLIVQGERDPLGTRAEVQTYDLSSTIAVRWLLDGDHDFKPRKKSGTSQEANWKEALAAVAEFVEAVG